MKEEVNPFLLECSAEPKYKDSRVGVKKTEALVDTSTSEVTGFTSIEKQYRYDPEPFIKVFVGSVRKMMRCGRTSSYVLGYILSSLERDKDYVFIDVDVCASACDLSTSQIRRSIKHLEGMSVIHPSEIVGKWYININMFFRGDRIRYIQNMRKKHGDLFGQ